MYRKVLVPTDLSISAHKFQDCLTAMPGIEKIALLHILEASNPKDLGAKGSSWDFLIDEVKTRLEEQADHLSDQTKKKLEIKTILKVVIQPISGAYRVNLQRPKNWIGCGFFSEVIHNRYVIKRTDYIIDLGTKLEEMEGGSRQWRRQNSWQGFSRATSTGISGQGSGYPNRI